MAQDAGKWLRAWRLRCSCLDRQVQQEPCRDAGGGVLESSPVQAWRPNRNGDRSSNKTAGRKIVPKGSMCLMGFRLTRPRR